MCERGYAMWNKGFEGLFGKVERGFERDFWKLAKQLLKVFQKV